jgi:hypothetical protein
MSLLRVRELSLNCRYISCLLLSDLLASVHLVGLLVVVHCAEFGVEDGMDEVWCECGT